MEKFKAGWKVVRAFLRRHAFIATLIGGAVAVNTYVHFQPPPVVGLEFEGMLPGYMRPDLKLKDDLGMLGFKAKTSNVIGMAYFDLLNGRLYNRGTRDAKDIEVKVNCEGNLWFGERPGFPVGRLTNTESDVVMKPDTYIELGKLRVDDPPLHIGMFSTWQDLKTITFRYKEGDATKTTRYLVSRDPVTLVPRIAREVLWGMVWEDFRRIARFFACVVVAFTLVTLVINLWPARVASVLEFAAVRLRSRSVVPPVSNATQATPPPPRQGDGKRQRPKKRGKRR